MWKFEKRDKNNARKNSKHCSSGHINRSAEVLVYPLKTGHLNILEIRRSGRKAINVEERGVKDPVTCRRAINLTTTLECAVIVTRIK